MDKALARAAKAAAKEYRDILYESDPSRLDRVFATHSRYSAMNALLIDMQRPDATDCRSYDDWLTVGRQVKRGEHGIRVFSRDTDDITTVFDVMQTYERS